MQVVKAIYVGRKIRTLETIKTKRQSEVLVIFPDEVEKIEPAEARKLLRGAGKGERLNEKLLKYRADEVRYES